MYLNHNYAAREFDIIYIGRIESYKNIESALKSFLNSSAKRMLVVGDGTDVLMVHKYKKLAIKQGKDILISKWVSEAEKFRLISCSKMLILPSTSFAEAYGIVQVEAFSVGTPVISCDIYRSGVGWVNINNFSGLTFKS